MQPIVYTWLMVQNCNIKVYLISWEEYWTKRTKFVIKYKKNEKGHLKEV